MTTTEDDAALKLDRLLRMTVPVPAGCVAPEGSPMTPEFRLSVQRVTDDGVHFIVHAHGHSSDTIDLVAAPTGLFTLAPFVAGETQDERIARTARLEASTRQVPTPEMIEALTPSGDTKAAYHGEFKFDVPLDGYDEDGEPLEGSKSVYVPWNTVKEIMATIRDRAMSQKAAPAVPSERNGE